MCLDLTGPGKAQTWIQQEISSSSTLCEENDQTLVQWNPREVNTLEVNSRLKSTPHGGPDFFLLCISNFISLKVNDTGPILG